MLNDFSESVHKTIKFAVNKVQKSFYKTKTSNALLFVLQVCWYCTVTCMAIFQVCASTVGASELQVVVGSSTSH